MHAVIIKGNPKYLNVPEATSYYAEIKEFLHQQGVTDVTFDPGDDYTCPDRTADLYIGHSRGVGRARCMSRGQEYRFLKFGDLDGYIHPVDAKWQRDVWTPGTDQQPPKEHFMFIPEQKAAILTLLNRLRNEKSHGPRRRPSV